MLTGRYRRPARLLAAGFFVLAVSGLALAQPSLGIGSAEPAFSSGGLFGGFLDWVNNQQQGFYRALSARR